MWNVCLLAELGFYRVANEHTGLWQGLGSAVVLSCLPYYNQVFSLTSWTWSISSLWHIFRKAVPFLTIIHGSDMVRSVRTWKITGLDVEDLHSFTKWLWVNPDLNECFWFCSRCGLLVSVRHRAHKEWEGWNGPFPLLIQGHHWHPWKGPPQQQEGR